MAMVMIQVVVVMVVMVVIKQANLCGCSGGYGSDSVVSGDCGADNDRSDNCVSYCGDGDGDDSGTGSGSFGGDVYSAR